MNETQFLQIPLFNPRSTPNSYHSSLLSSLRHGCAAVTPPAHAAVALCCCRAAVAPHIRATVASRACAAAMPPSLLLSVAAVAPPSPLSLTRLLSQSSSQKLD
ncbi:uncharacterized protein DS421_20g706020 [Arachis hypogaea]|nr:uncharacterized protein DS421_20g706020 [Arachis hypogaea]